MRRKWGKSRGMHNRKTNKYTTMYFGNGLKNERERNFRKGILNEKELPL